MLNRIIHNFKRHYLNTNCN